MVKNVVEESHREQQLMAEQARGPVDVLSLSLVAALGYFFVVVWWQRRKRKKAALAAAAALPTAKVVRLTPQR